MGSLVAELAEKLSSATNNFDIDSGTIYVNTSADTVGIGTTTPGSKLDVQGTMQVGVNDTGHDVKFFGATAGAYLEWDESDNELELRGGAASAGKLLLTTAETTVVDGNQLGQIAFQAPLDSAGSDAILIAARILAEASGTFSSSSNATDLVFGTGASESATEKMRITSDGKVGIGTTAPSKTLTVSGDTDNAEFFAAMIENRNYAANESGQSVSISFGLNKGGSGVEEAAKIKVSKDSDWDDDANADSSLSFFTKLNGASAEKLRITSTGNVGIGTSALESWDSNWSPAVQIGATSTVANYGDTDLYILENAWHDGSWKYQTTSHASKLGIYAGTFNFAVAGSGTADAAITWTDVLKIDNSGKVGIGTTAPSAELTVMADDAEVEIFQPSSPNYGDIKLKIGQSTSATNQTHIWHDGLNAKTYIENRYESTSAYGQMYIRQNISGTHTSIITLDRGNVGIGTTGPSDPLTVEDTSVDAAAVAINHRVAQAIDTGPRIKFNNVVQDQTANIYLAADIRVLKENGTDNNHDHYLSFRIRRNSPEETTERMRIASNGIVTINGNFRQRKAGVAISTSNNFSVVQKWISTDGTGISSSGTYSWADTYSYGPTTSAFGGFRWYQTSGTGQGDQLRLLIDKDTGEVEGNLTDTSDGRLKENIEKLADGALSTIKELNPVKFAWKDTKKVNSGFVAQDVEKILPEVMGGREERKAIHTSGILAYAVKAIQELTEKVETQEKEIALLKG